MVRLRVIQEAVKHRPAVGMALQRQMKKLRLLLCLIILQEQIQLYACVLNQVRLILRKGEITKQQSPQPQPHCSDYRVETPRWGVSFCG